MILYPAIPTGNAIHFSLGQFYRASQVGFQLLGDGLIECFLLTLVLRTVPLRKAQTSPKVGLSRS